MKLFINIESAPRCLLIPEEFLLCQDNEAQTAMKSAPPKTAMHLTHRKPMNLGENE
jgi:hypothetical protein